MAHMKTQMDLLTKHLLVGGVDKVKTVGSKGRAYKSDLEKEANYMNNQGVFGPMVKEAKVETIKGITNMTRPIIEFVIKGIGRVRMTEEGRIYH